MVVIWTGFGILIPVIYLLGFGGAAFIGNLIFGDALNSEAERICVFFGLALSSITCWFLHKYLVKKGTKTLLDKETGEDVVLKPSHSLFFIPMHWWGVIGAAVTTFLLFDIIKELLSA